MELHFFLKLFNFSQIKKKKRVIFSRFSFRDVDLRNWRTDFVVWGLVKFTFARRIAVKIFRTLSKIVNSLQSCKDEKHKKTPNKICFNLFYVL